MDKTETPDYLSDLLDEQPTETKATEEKKDAASDPNPPNNESEKKDGQDNEANKEDNAANKTDETQKQLSELKESLTNEMRASIDEIKKSLVNQPKEVLPKEKENKVNETVQQAEALLNQMVQNKQVDKGHLENFENVLNSILAIRTKGAIKNTADFGEKLELIRSLGESVTTISDAQLGSEFSSALNELKADPMFNKKDSVLTAQEFIDKVFLPAVKSNPDYKKQVTEGLRYTPARQYLAGMYKEALGTLQLDDSYLKQNKELNEIIDRRKRNTMNPTGDPSSELHPPRPEEKKKRTHQEIFDDEMMRQVSYKSFLPG